jgi:hypothetical protein
VFISETNEKSVTIAQAIAIPIHPFSISPQPTRPTEFAVRPPQF